EVVFHNLQCPHLSLGHLDAEVIATGIELCPDRESGLGGRGANELDDHLVADKWTAAPVLRDVREEFMFDLVPLAGPRRKVAYTSGEAGRVRNRLERHLPQTIPVAVAAARVGRHEDIPRDVVCGTPDRPPPLADGRHGKLRSVMINADAYPPFLTSNIVDAVW